jgi:hypothetical protein
MEKQWQIKFTALETKMNDLSKSVATDVINAILHSDQMPFLNKTEFYQQRHTQRTAMTAIMEKSHDQDKEIKKVFYSIESSLGDGPTIASPPCKIRQNRDLVLPGTSGESPLPPPSEVGTDKRFLHVTLKPAIHHLHTPTAHKHRHHQTPSHSSADKYPSFLPNGSTNSKQRSTNRHHHVPVLSMSSVTPNHRSSDLGTTPTATYSILIMRACGFGGTMPTPS